MVTSRKMVRRARKMATSRKMARARKVATSRKMVRARKVATARKVVSARKVDEYSKIGSTQRGMTSLKPFLLRLSKTCENILLDSPLPYIIQILLPGLLK